MKRINLILIMSLVALLSHAAIETFEYQGIKFKYNTYHNFMETGDNSGLKGVVTVPSKIEYQGRKYTVTHIGDYSFAHCPDITKVIIEEGYQQIGSGAFKECSSLREVVLPTSVWVMYDDIFRDCVNLSNVNTGSVQKMGARVFYNCENLHHVELTSLKDLDVNGGIFSYATGLEDITLPEGIKIIGCSSFANCTSLTQLRIPSTVTKIGSWIINGCTNLKTLYWDAKDAKTYISIGGNAAIKDGPSSSVFTEYGKPPYLETIVFGDEVSSIPSLLCYNLTSLKKVVFGKSVNDVGPNVFYNCIGLKEVHWNATNCVSNNAKFWWTKNSTRIAAPISIFEIGDFVKRIPDYLCSHLTKVEDIVIPATVKSIGDHAFQGTAISSVNLPTGLETIGLEAFSEMPRITSFNIPWSVIEIGNGAFGGCPNLKRVIFNAQECSVDNPFSDSPQLSSIDFNNEVRIVPANICNGISSLKTVHFGSSVRTIGANSFRGCSGLEDVELCGAISKINAMAFAGCSSLSSLLIGSNVREIGEQTFANCRRLKSISIQAITPPVISQNTFTDYTAVLQVPYDCEKRYAEAKYWSNFFPGAAISTVMDDNDIITITDGKITVPDHAAGTQVYDMTGAIVYSGYAETIEGLSSGVYIVRNGRHIAKVAILTR